MDDLAVMRDGHRPRLVEGMSHIITIDHIAIHGSRAPAVHRRDMRTGHAHQRRRDLEPGGGFGLLNRMRDRLGGRGQIHDDTFADSLRRLDAHTQDADGFVILHPPHEGAHLGRSDINAYNNFFHVIDSSCNKAQSDTSH